MLHTSYYKAVTSQSPFVHVRCINGILAVPAHRLALALKYGTVQRVVDGYASDNSTFYLEGYIGSESFTISRF